MSALCTPRRGMQTRVRPVTPMGQDLPEDTPSKIRARNAMECADLRRTQERETMRAELETGLDLHHHMKEDRARRAAHAKADAELRRELLAKQSAYTRAAQEQEAERIRLEKASETEDRKASEALKELQRLELELERRETRQSVAERMLHSKQSKEMEEARERALAKKDYEDGQAERRRQEELAKATKKAEVEARKAAILEARDLKIKERALAAAMLRAEIEEAREAAIAKQEEEKIAAENRRQELRARSNQYREDKELARTSAFAR